WMDGIASLMDTAAVLTTGSTGGWQQSRADQATQDQALAAAQRERLRLRILLRQSRRQQALDQAAATSSSPAATPGKPRRRGSGGGYDISAFMAPGGGRAVNEMDAAIARMTPFQAGEAERGLMGASSQELQEEQFANVTRMARQYAGAMYDTMQDVNKRRKGAAGGGILGELLYGENGPTGMLAELGTALDEGANMMTAAGQQMAAGMAQALTAAIVEGRNFKSAMAQATREVLKGLATQAFTKAIFHTAEGFGALALGPIGGLTAAQHFKAAAMFGAVGVSAGLGARSIGTGSSAGAGSGAPVRAGGSSFGSGLGSRGAANDNQQPITFNLTVLPGGEAEAGRAVYKALDAYFRESGRVPTFAATGTGP
ncbi:MAG TPA: hypothetical protein VD931_13660, partial [Baekduia sp.]|nr:hypothetical protein [Baekduia sp.]